MVHVILILKDCVQPNLMKHVIMDILMPLKHQLLVVQRLMMGKYCKKLFKQQLIIHLREFKVKHLVINHVNWLTLILYLQMILKVLHHLETKTQYW